MRSSISYAFWTVYSNSAIGLLELYPFVMAVPIDEDPLYTRCSVTRLMLSELTSLRNQVDISSSGERFPLIHELAALR